MKEAVTHSFQAETRQVLQLMIHSLYSNKEIFLRELISNASDALDRLRFAGIQDASLLPGSGDLRIEIETDPDAGTLTIRDNGIGMSHAEVMDNIGTIARSGTRQFLEQLSLDDKAGSQLIGQFGVGFYSSFIVADAVTLATRKAGSPVDQGVEWTSDGGGDYTIQNQPIEAAGTTVTLHLKPAEKEFANAWTVRSLINRYSDHIGFPILLRKASSGETDSETPEWEQVNKATALWALPKSDISDDEYQSFYKYLSHDTEDALCWAHNKVEGAQSYTSLLYVPRHAPFDLMLQRDERSGLRLYVNRVFIMDAAQPLLPAYLRFVRGVVDSQDLPLNVSRELLQENELVGKIRAAVTRRSLDMLERLSREQPEDYKGFWEQFGMVLKEGVIEDFSNRERILSLLRLASTHDATPGARTDLAAYVARMKPAQSSIYYITAENHQAAGSSPHLEVFRKRGIEVLLLSDRVDEWMMAYLPEFDGKPFKSVAKGDLESVELADEVAPSTTAEDENQDLPVALLDRISALLNDRVKGARASRRLTESASCLVLSEHELPLHLQKMLRQGGQDVPETLPTLELNPQHALVQKLCGESDDERFSMLATLLYEQAVLAEGGTLPDPAGFVRRINQLMTAIPV